MLNLNALLISHSHTACHATTSVVFTRSLYVHAPDSTSTCTNICRCRSCSIVVGGGREASLSPSVSFVRSIMAAGHTRGSPESSPAPRARTARGQIAAPAGQRTGSMQGSGTSAPLAARWRHETRSGRSGRRGAGSSQIIRIHFALLLHYGGLHSLIAPCS